MSDKIPDWARDSSIPDWAREEEEKKQKRGIIEDVVDIGTAAFEGIPSVGRRLKAAGQTLVGSLSGVEETARREQEAAAQTKAGALAEFKQDLAARGQVTDGSWTQAAKDLGGAIAQTPAAVPQLVAEQLPNAAVTLGAGAVGFKAGAVVAPFLGPLAPLAPIAGGLIGLFVGNTAIETGSKAIEKAGDGFTPQERGETLKEGATKGAVISAVDAATFGATKLLYSPVGRAMEQAGAKALADAGVDLTNRAAVETALKSAPIRTAVESAQAAALKSANAGGAGLARGTGAFGLQTVGEGAGEGLGEYAATGEVNPTDVLLEAVASAGQSAAEIAIAKTRSGASGLIDAARGLDGKAADPDAALTGQADRLTDATDAYLRGGLQTSDPTDVLSSVVSAPTPNGDIGAAITAADQAAGPSIEEMMRQKRQAAADRVAQELGYPTIDVNAPADGGLIADIQARSQAAVSAAQAELGLPPATAPVGQQDFAARRESAARAAQAEMGIELPTAPEVVGDQLTPVQKQELVRQQMQAPARAPDLVTQVQQQVQTEPATTSQDVARVRTEVEEQALQRWQAEYDQQTAAQAEKQGVEAAKAATETQARMRESQDETALAELDRIAQGERQRAVDSLVRAYGERTQFSSAATVLQTNQQLTRLGQQPLTKAERDRVVTLLDSARTFTAPAQEQVQVTPDRGADNAVLEQQIPEKKDNLPRPANIGGQPASSYSVSQLTDLIANTSIPAITRRGAQVELLARQQEQAAQAPEAPAVTPVVAPAGPTIVPSAKRTPEQGLQVAAAKRSEKTGQQVTFTVADVATLPTMAKAGDGLSKQAHTIINNVSRVFGKKLVVFDSDDAGAADGFVIDDDPDTIYLNRKSEVPHLVVFGHELLHSLRRDNKDAYESIVKSIKMAEGVDISETPGIRGDIEEFTADLLGNRFRETEFWVGTFRDIIASKGQAEGKKVVTRLAATATRAINGLMKALGRAPGFNTDKMVANLGDVKTALRGALSNYANQRYDAAVALERERLQGSLRSESAPSVESEGEVITSARRGEKPGQLDGLVGYHFSNQARQTLSTGFYGTGLRGSDRDEIQSYPDKRVGKRLSFYFDKGTGVRPESGVGGVAHRVALDNIYDSDSDPLKLKRGANKRAFEAAVLDAGFDGYMTRLEGTQPGQVVVLGDRTYQPEVLGPRSRIDDSEPAVAQAAQEPQWKNVATGPTREGLQDRMARMESSGSWSGYDMQIVEAGRGFYALQTRPKSQVAASEKRQTETPEFKRWFGDSKVVDAEGKPLLMYHGTSKDADFYRFKTGSRGAWFTSDPEIASEYAQDNDSRGLKYNPDTRRYDEVNSASRVIPVYLSVKNPYRLTPEDAFRVNVAGYARAQAKLFEEIKARGYDGILWNDRLNKEWVVFSPEQVKSAIGNRGPFDPENPDIRYSDKRGQLTRGGVKEEVGGFTIRTQKDGTLGVLGDVQEIRALMPAGVVGRPLPGGILFPASQAQRVRAALEGRKVAYSRAGQVVERLPMKDGKYVGAPEKYNTPAKIATLRRNLRNLADEGAPGRYWYENSSREVLAMVGGNVQEARKFVALLAIYSPQAKVISNSTFALRAWAQYKAGQPISVKTGVMDRKAQSALDDVDAFWSGEKTGNFFNNLLREIDPSLPQGATIDMWMMRAAEYASDAPTATQYAFMENETNRLAQELGWEPQQVQAAIWVAMKARMENAGVKTRTEATSEKKGWIRFERNAKGKKVRVIVNAQAHRDNWLKHAFQHDPTKSDTQGAKFDFSDGLRRHIGQLSWEARPGRTTGVLPGVNDAPYEQQVEFQQAVQKALLDDDGVDLLAYKLGLLVDGPDILAPGVWQGEIAAGMQKQVGMAPAKGDEGKTRIDPAQKKTLEVYASTLGLLLRQEGVGYHRPFYKNNKSDENAVNLDIGRTFTPAEAQTLWGAIDQRMRAEGVPNWEENAGLISSPDGMRVLNFGAVGDNVAFRKMVAEAAETLPFDEVELQSFSSDGDLITNNWKDNPNGEGYRSRISEAYGSYLLDWTRDVLAPRVQSVFDEFSSKYGWGNAGNVQDLFQRPAALAPFTRARSLTQRQAGDTGPADVVASEKRQTETPEFKAWFGDSKAVVAVNAETGLPLVSSREPKKLVPQVMYHTTRNDFSEFEIGRMTTNSGTFGDWETSRAAAFVTPDLEASQAYGTQGGGFANGANVMPLYVKAENPLDLTGGVSEQDAQRLIDAGMSERYVYNGLGNWTMFDDAEGRENVELIKRAGYDSVIFNDENPDTGDSFEAYALFSPTQIKSAIGNTGAFDPTNPDIRYSEKRNIFGQKVPASFNVPNDTKMDQFIRYIQDKQIDTKRVVDAIKGAVGKIEDKWNAYLQEELYHGRTAKATKNFLSDELRPLMEGLAKSGVSRTDFEEYLHNRHAEERNAQIAKINPAFPDGGSGITNADARKYLSSLSPDKRRTMETLARQVDQITKNTRKLLVDSGLENQDTINNWESTYKNYVPLFREDADFDPGSGGTSTGQGFSVRGPSSRRATGSSREVVDILANVALQREKAIVRSQKLRVSTAVYGLALQNPNTDFWLAVDPKAIKDTFGVMGQLVQMGMDPDVVENIMREPTRAVPDARTGLVTQRVNQFLRSAENVLAVRINGEEKYVFFNTRNERGERMVRALKNLDAQQLGQIMSMSAAVSRYFASINTQYNPIFGAINLIRDTQGALFNLTTTPIADRKAGVMAGIAPALAGIYADLRSRRKGRGPAGGQWGQLWEEFQREGGQTGFRDMFATSEDRTRALQRMIDPSSWAESPLGKVFTANGTLKVPLEVGRKVGAPVFNWLSDYNETLENAVRLSAYKQALDKGMTKQQAASVAKNLTVNFNRKGDIGVQAGALYAFFNASVQGTARLYETLKGPAGRKILAGGALLGVMQALALAAAGFDEDQPPDFVKERNLVLPTGDGTYLTIPMPLGLNVLPNTSRVLTEWAMSGFKDSPKRVAQITGSFLEMFNPIGNSGWSVQTIAPTFADPLVALGENRDWTGKPIAKEDRSGTSPTPGYTRARDTATWIGKQLSYYMNLASGGTDYKQGLFSPTPDQIDYLLGQLTGGVGREALKVGQLVETGVTGEDLSWTKTPIVGRFYGDTKEQAAVSGKFYENLTRINEHEAEIKGRIRDRVGGVSEYIRDNPEARLTGVANRIESDLTDLRRRRREMVQRGASRESIRIVEQQITNRMKQLNEMVDKLEATTQ